MLEYEIVRNIYRIHVLAGDRCWVRLLQYIYNYIYIIINQSMIALNSMGARLQGP